MLRPVTTVVLFDVDGTLVRTSSGRRAIERAFAAVTGRGDACDHFRFGGMTDRAIARAGLRAVGAQDDEATIDRLLEAYVGFLAEEVPRCADYRVLPGVEPLLDRLEGRAGVAIGLGTGNVEVGARTKLRRARLDGRFAFGGFGSDAEARASLLDRGRARGAAALGVAPDRVRTVVVGDTPRDVEAARAIGATVVAVATGTHDAAALRTHAPDLLVEDLRDGAVVEALLGPG